MATKTNDFMPFDANEYRAVVNPTNLTIQAWGYGRRLVLQPGNVENKKRSCVQFVKTRIARKAVKNKRKLLELWDVEHGMQLLNKAKELGNFHEAYRAITGRRVNKAGELLAEKAEKDMLRRVLSAHHGIGDDLTAPWTVSDMRAILKDPTLVTDLDGSGRPRINAPAQGSIFEAAERAKARATPKPNKWGDLSGYVSEGEPGERLLDGTRRIDEGGLPGDTLDPEFIPERLDDSARLPEDVAAEATLAYDVNSGGRVAGAVAPHVAAQQRAFKGLQVSEKDILAPLPEPQDTPTFKNDQEEIISLRARLEALGEKPHSRSGVVKLRDDLEAATLRAAEQNGE